MCNCTTLGPLPQRPAGVPPTSFWAHPQQIRQASSDSDKAAHKAARHGRAKPHGRTKKIALDPAESSAIYDAPCVAA